MGLKPPSAPTGQWEHSARAEHQAKLCSADLVTSRGAELPEEHAQAIHAGLPGDRVRRHDILEQHGRFKVFECGSEADTHEDEAFKRVLEAPAQSPRGVPLVLEVVYLEDERREIAEAAAEPEDPDMESVAFTAVFADLERSAGTECRRAAASALTVPLRREQAWLANRWLEILGRKPSFRHTMV